MPMRQGSGGKDLLAAADRHRVERRMQQGEVRRGRRGCPHLFGGRAASASERVSRPSRGCGSSSVEKRSNGERYDGGRGLLPGVRMAVVEEARQRPPETFEILLHSCPEYPIPDPGLSVPAARIPCMATAFDDTGQHPVTSTIAAVSHQLREVADLGLWTLGAAETDANLSALAALRHQITELELRHAQHADRLDLGAQAGAADTASWWANQTRQTKRDTKRRLALATALDHDHEPVRDAMAAGTVSEDQAAVIVKGVDALPVEHRRKAETHLIGLRRRTRPGRAAPARPPRPRSRRPRDRRSPRAPSPATPGSTRRGSLPVHHHRRRTRPVPRPVHPPSPVAPSSSRRCSRSTHPDTATTPAPPKDSGTRSASTSPATPSTGSPRPAASTPPSWSP